MPVVQIKSQDKNPVPALLIRYDDSYARTWEPENEFPIFDKV